MKQYINGIEVKSTNYKKYADMLRTYRRTVYMHGYRYVRDCYVNPSSAKIAAEYRILDNMIDRNGYGYTVTGYNPVMFTGAYLFPHPEGGNLILCYETPYHTYYVDAAGL